MIFRKTIKRLVFITGFSLIQLSMVAQTTNIDTVCNLTNQLVDNLTKALLRNNMCIGVFEIPSSIKLNHLKSGILPEGQKDYLSLMISENLLKLNTYKVIKGEFDSCIFIKYPKYSLNEEVSRSNPIFYSGSKWLLFLEKSIEKGESKMSWTAELYKKDRKVFNESTLFLNAFEYNYGICLKWPDNKTIDANTQVVNENLIFDLQQIAETLAIKDTDKKTKKLQQISEDEIKNVCSKEIIQKILYQLNQ